jgi:hypothetical protein
MNVTVTSPFPADAATTNGGDGAPATYTDGDGSCREENK